MVLHYEQGSLTLQYVAIPFGIHCRVDVRIPNRKGNENDEIVNVNGKIVARYADTYSSADDNDDESLVDDESEGGILDQKIEQMDTDGDDEYSDDDDDGESPIDESGDVLSSSPNRYSWCLRSHKNKPRSTEAVEIFSVFIGQEKSKAVQIYGSIELLNGLDIEFGYIFKKDENDALGLSENVKSISIPDGSRVFDDCSSLEMKFDIKDVEGCLAIKGYGQHGGFAAIHYSIFSKAVRVTINVLLNLKTRSLDVNPKVSSFNSYSPCY
ncbi:hypothetical protein LIER_34504 [Lithospermum erythrorhizon]|uniref:Uncharacterized protein n=1 Tax=Lithospermum erythrorhizon TaxID=34254 RepID=A0AAV3S3U0_LITER